MLASGLLVVHNTGGGGQDDVAELTGRQQLDNPLLEVGKTDVVSGRDDTGLVETNDLVSDLRAIPDAAVKRTGRSAEQQSCQIGGRRPPRTRRWIL